MSFGILTMIVALQASPDLTTSMELSTAADTVELFEHICFDTFPDPAAAKVAIDSHPATFEIQPKTATQAMQPGDAWFSSNARVTYADADWLPRDLPSPQCGVTTTIPSGHSHSALASTLTAQLGLPEGKIGKDKPQSQSRWDMPGKGSDKWRLFLSTSSTPSGVEMSIMILNLRGKK